MRRLISVSVMVALISLSSCSKEGSAPPSEADVSGGPGISDTDLGVSPREDYVKLMAECLAAKGWDVSVNADNSMSSEYPVDQESQYMADEEECQNTVGDLPPVANTQAEAETIWNEMLDAADCVAELNSDWAPDAPPSKESAIEALQQDPIDLGDWGPHMNVPPDQIEYSYTACPTPAI